MIGEVLGNDDPAMDIAISCVLLSYGNIDISDQVHNAAFIQSLLQVASNPFLITLGVECFIAAVAVLIYHSQLESPGFETYSHAVDAKNDTRQEEDEDEEEPVPLHGDP